MSDEIQPPQLFEDLFDTLTVAAHKNPQDVVSTHAHVQPVTSKTVPYPLDKTLISLDDLLALQEKSVKEYFPSAFLALLNKTIYKLVIKIKNHLFKHHLGLLDNMRTPPPSALVSLELNDIFHNTALKYVKGIVSDRMSDLEEELEIAAHFIFTVYMHWELCDGGALTNPKTLQKISDKLIEDECDVVGKCVEMLFKVWFEINYDVE
jgi:hypothetical protein